MRDWIDEITRKARAEIVVLFDNEDLEASIKVQRMLLFVVLLNLCVLYISPIMKRRRRRKNVQL